MRSNTFKDIPLLIVANKASENGAMSEEEILHFLELDSQLHISIKCFKVPTTYFIINIMKDNALLCFGWKRNKKWNRLVGRPIITVRTKTTGLSRIVVNPNPISGVDFDCGYNTAPSPRK